MSSVRFICGTQDIHRELERKIAEFFGKEDIILYSSCFDANAGLFETLIGEEDVVISDEPNHASIIDGIRLPKVWLPTSWRKESMLLGSLIRLCQKKKREYASRFRRLTRRES